MEQEPTSIFRRYFVNKPFTDRFLTEQQGAIDVLIPLVHTNELWRSNLLSIYREIPVNRLLIGDGGCIDDSIEVVQDFPRVVIFDHSDFVSLGYSIRKLIEAVETEWFVYLHSDVYLPEGWFDAMRPHQDRYDWFECGRHITFLVDYPLDLTDTERAYSGSQMGRKAAFRDVLPVIDDDYLYRNEDIILADLVKRAGFRYGRVGDTFHYHQVMETPGPWSRRIGAFSLQVEQSREEEIRASMMQAKGIIKYMNPRSDFGVAYHVARLLDLGELSWSDFKRWVVKTDPAWLPYIRRELVKERLRAFLRAAYRLFFG